MPLSIAPDELRQSGISLNLPIEVDEPPSAGVVDLLSAAFQTQNATYDLVTRPERPPPTPSFNPLDHLLEGEEFIAHELSGARSLAELNQLREEHRRQVELRRKLGSGPAGLIASMIAAVADPIPLMAGGGVFAAGRGLAAAGRLAQGLRGAAAGAVDIGVQEALLAQTQPERQGQIAASMAIGAIAGGVLGTALARTATDDLATMVNVAAPEGVGADVSRLRPEDTELAPGFGLPQAFGRMGKLFSAPAIRILNSQFASARDAVLRLTDVGVLTKGVLRGVAVPQSADVATRARLFSEEAAMLKVFRTAYQEYKRGGGQHSYAEFRQLVGRSMRRGDRSDNATVAATASVLRQFIARIEQAAGDLIPEELKLGAQGLPRDFVVNLLKMQPSDFISRMARVFRSESVDRLPLFPGAEDVLKLSEDDAEEAARALWGALVRESRVGRLPLLKKLPGVEDISKIPDSVLEDFLEDDALLVLGRWMRTVISDTELGRMLGQVDPDEGLANVARNVRDEATVRTQGKTPREVKAINDEAEEVIDLLTTIFNRVRGTDAPARDPALDSFRRLGRIARNITSTQLMGSVAISNLGDAATAIISQGLGRMMGTVFADMGRGFRGIRMSRRQAQQFGTALEVALHSRRSAITGASEMRIEELGKAATIGERVEAGVQRGTDLFFKLTLLSPLIDTIKSATSAVVSTRILGAADKVARGVAVSAADRRALAAAGLDDDMLRRFAAEADKWERVGGITLGGVDGWADREAVRAFGNALLREVDTAVITPFAGDLPRLFDSEWGRIILQFKRFSAASTSRLLTLSAQRLRAGELRVLNGIATAVGIGAGITILKDLSIAGEVRERSTPQLIADAVDRSGVAMIAYEMNAIMDVVGLGPISLASGQPSRFAARGPFERLAGPVVGQAQGITVLLGRLAKNAGDSPFTQSELRSLRYSTPGQNLIGLGLLYNKTIDMMAQSLPKQEPRR